MQQNIHNMNKLREFVRLIVLLQSKSTSEPTDSQPLPFNIQISEKLKLRGPPTHSNPFNDNTKYIH